MKRILYIDGFNLFYRMLAVKTSLDEEGEPNGAFVGFTLQLQKLIARFHPQHVFVVFDGIDAGYYRRQLFPNYKGRQARKQRFAALGESIDEKVQNEDRQLLLIYEFLQQVPVITLSVNYYEADDIIAFLVKRHLGQYEQIIASSDQDYAQLVGPQTYWYSFAHKTLYDENAIIHKYGVPACNLLYRRLVTGEDKSDKIEGIRGLGKTTLVKVMPSLITEPISSCQEFLTKIEALTGEDKRTQKLKQGTDIILRNYEMCQLHNPRLTRQAQDYVVDAITDLPNKQVSLLRLKAWCINKRLELHIKRFDMWVHPFRFLQRTLE